MRLLGPIETPHQPLCRRAPGIPQARLVKHELLGLRGRLQASPGQLLARTLWHVNPCHW